MKRIKIFSGICVLLISVFLHAGSTAEIETRVVPIVTTSLVSAPTYYNFGNLEVGTSSNSVTALVLTNDGTVGIKIEKTVWDDDGWDITKSTEQLNGFNLWAQIKAARPDTMDFTETSTHKFSKDGVGASYYSVLTDATGIQVDLTPGATANFIVQNLL